MFNPVWLFDKDCLALKLFTYEFHKDGELFVGFCCRAKQELSKIQLMEMLKNETIHMRQLISDSNTLAMIPWGALITKVAVALSTITYLPILGDSDIALGESNGFIIKIKAN